MTPTLHEHPQKKRCIAELQALSSQHKVVLIHDGDADGLTSATLFYKFLRDRNIPVCDTITHIAKGNIISSQNIEKIKQHKPTHIISTDLDLAHMTGFTQLQQQVQATYIVQDHHTVNPFYEAHPDIIYINPIQIAHMQEGSQYCSAKFVYDILNEITDMSEYQYIAAIGILGDHCTQTWDDFLLEVAAKQQFNVKITQPKDWYTTPLGEIVEHIIISAAISQDAFVHVCTYVMRAQSYKDILTITKHEQHDSVKHHLDTLVQQYTKYTQYDKQHNLYIIEHDSPYTISGPLTTLLSYQDHDAIWLVLHPHNDSIRIHLRNQSQRIHCGNTLKHICAQLTNASGGGHGPAAGARINASDKQTCINKLKTFIQTQQKQ